MATVKIRYLVAKKRRNGTVHHLWQPSRPLREKGWKIVSLPDDPYEAQAEAQRLNAKLDAWYAGEGSVELVGKTGSIDALICEYKKSNQYKTKAKKTRTFYDENFLVLSRLVGDVPSRGLRPKHAVKLYESLAYDRKKGNKILRKGTPARAHAVMRCARLLFSFGERADLVDTNPFRNLGLKNKAAKSAIWSREQVELFEAAAAEDGFFGLAGAVMLNEWFGQRRADILAMTQSNIKDGRIQLTQNKTGAEVFLPFEKIPHLRDRVRDLLIVAENKNNGRDFRCRHLIQTKDGTAYTAATFRRDFEYIRAACAKKYPEKGFEALTFRTLRHTAVTRLGAANVSTAGIAAITGHALKTCEGILEVYNIRTLDAAVTAFETRHTYEQARQKGKDTAS